MMTMMTTYLVIGWYDITAYVEDVAIFEFPAIFKEVNNHHMMIGGRGYQEIQ